MKGIDIFMHMIKCKLHPLLKSSDDKNPKLVEIYREKCKDYLERAEYIKKTVLLKKYESQAEAGG